VPWPTNVCNPAIASAPTKLSQRLGAHPVIHRNLKSPKILVDEAGQVRLLDFGVAQRPEWYERLMGRLPYRSAMALASDSINSPVAGADR
jgi:serine/threonine protein kinase